LQPVTAIGEKAPKSLSLLAGGADWPPHEQVWRRYKQIYHYKAYSNKNKSSLIVLKNLRAFQERGQKRGEARISK